MGVMIKGMEMPKGCDKCRFHDGVWCVAKPKEEWRTAYFRPPSGEKQDNCPLVEIPKHGRLIDADEAAEYIWELLGFPSNLANAQWFIDALREMPTIIPADKGEDA